ncbi:hypothetical protein LXM94_10290 [Rhizobium sp. TRM95111]|uniref:hypothetical protein n=1 Tax=Rhizobium alarense TaxID=2846851 RepID=UPI001F3ED865|nr:hypothetical protein [Rhizobium alarense]MCF3640353.1 hypothetical protein [Rhizobium alarense]
MNSVFGSRSDREEHNLIIESVMLLMAEVQRPFRFSQIMAGLRMNVPRCAAQPAFFL